MENTPVKRYGSISHSFKITIVMLLFFLIFVRLATLIYFPSAEIVPDKVFLFVVLFVVSYLWVQESADIYSLIKVNKELRKTHDRLEEAELETITALIKAEEEKDEYTKGHSDRVTVISLAIAEEMKLSGESRDILARAGILHDIGKIGISENILNKKERLTDEEWALIKSHVENSVKILMPLKFLSREREAVFSHHERYDGKGYPRGLKGADICLEAKIMAVADAFDAMNSKRPYRDPLSKEAIIQELIKSKGTQHSADIVDTFLALLKKKPQLWEKKS